MSDRPVDVVQRTPLCVQPNERKSHMESKTAVFGLKRALRGWVRLPGARCIVAGTGRPSSTWAKAETVP